MDYVGLYNISGSHILLQAMKPNDYSDSHNNSENDNIGGDATPPSTGLLSLQYSKLPVGLLDIEYRCRNIYSQFSPCTID